MFGILTEKILNERELIDRLQVSLVFTPRAQRRFVEMLGTHQFEHDRPARLIACTVKFGKAVSANPLCNLILITDQGPGF